MRVKCFKNRKSKKIKNILRNKSIENLHFSIYNFTALTIIIITIITVGLESVQISCEINFTRICYTIGG